MQDIKISTYRKIKLNSYHPLCRNILGLNAINQYNLHPYLDGSCRREPDFNNERPSITALCRQGAFAPKLWPNDIVVYVSLEDHTGNSENKRLISILRVIARFETHAEAAHYYQTEDLNMPSNCLIPNNPPEDFEKTAWNSWDAKRMKAFLNRSPERRKVIGKRIITTWDDEYHNTASEWPVFLVCRSYFNVIFNDNRNPPIITRNDFIRMIGRYPNTRNPIKITFEQLVELGALANIRFFQ